MNSSYFKISCELLLFVFDTVFDIESELVGFELVIVAVVVVFLEVSLGLGIVSMLVELTN